MAGYIGQAPANKFLTLDKQTFTTSATDTYSLDKTVSSANEIELFLNNVRQEPIEAYTVSGNTLTLASAITSSNTMYCIYQGKAIGSISPATNSVSNDMLVNSSLSVNGTSISLGASGTISAGITEADGFRLTADFSTNSATVTGFERIDDATFSKIGTGMTESSGVFTFPTTGLYMVTANCTFQTNSPDLFSAVIGQVSTDSGSNYDNVFRAIFGYEGPNTSFNTNSQSSYVNVTNASTFRMKFTTDSFGSGTNINGNTNENFSAFFFIRLGDSS